MSVGSGARGLGRLSDSMIALAVSLAASGKVSAPGFLGEQPADCLTNCSDGPVRGQTIVQTATSGEPAMERIVWTEGMAFLPFLSPLGYQKLHNSQSLW